MAIANKFSDSLGPQRLFDFILAEDESDATRGTWIGCTIARDQNGLPRLRKGFTPVIGQRVSEGRISTDDADPLSHLVWRQDDWSGGALTTWADKKDNGYIDGTFDAAWGSLAPGIAKNFGGFRGNDGAPIGWMLSNPHFESTADDGWSDDSGGSGTVDMQDTDDFRSAILGAQSCKITWTGTTADVAIISQSLANFAVWQGISITVSCYFKKESGSGGVQIAISDGVGTTRGTGVTSASDWTLVTATRTIDAGATEVTVTLETEDTNTFTGRVEDFTVYSVASTIDPVGIVALDADDIYMAAGRIVAQLDTSTEDQLKWDAVYISASGIATDIITYHDTGTPGTNVYVGFGSTQGYIYGSDTTWTVSTLASTAKNAFYFAVNRNTLWKSEDANTIKNATNPLNGGSWASDHTIGDTNRPITDLYSYDDTIIAAKEDGIWKYRRYFNDGGSADEFENRTNEFVNVPSENNFKRGSEFIDGLLYVPVARGGLLRISPNAIQDVSHLVAKPTSGFNGVVHTMAQDTKNLWTFVDDRLVALMYDESGNLVVHTRGDQPSVSPQSLAASETTTFDTGWLSAGTAAQEDEGSDTEQWTAGNLSNITASDDSRADVPDSGSGSWGSSQTTYLLKATNFSASVPDNADITGIEVRVEAKLNAGGGGVFVDENKRQLIKGGNLTGDNKSGTRWDSATESTKDKGSSSDTWGETWTPSEVNASTFGVGIKWVNPSVTLSAGAFLVDHVAIKIHYTITASNQRVLLPKAAQVVPWNVSSVETPHLLGVYGGQDSTDSEPYLITDCWALPDEGLAPVLDSADLPASPTTHKFTTSRWSGNQPTEIKVASHIDFRLKNMDPTQPVTVRFGTDGLPSDSFTLGTLNGTAPVQTLRFGDISDAQEAAVFTDICLNLEGTYTGTLNKREIEAFQLHSWPLAELFKLWQISIQMHGSVMGNGQESTFSTAELAEFLDDLEDITQKPRWVYLIEDFDGDGAPTSTTVALRPGASTEDVDATEGPDDRIRLLRNIVLQETDNVS